MTRLKSLKSYSSMADSVMLPAVGGGDPDMAGNFQSVSDFKEFVVCSFSSLLHNIFFSISA